MTDRKLSPHFSLFQLTRTDHADLQELNRAVNLEQETKLEAVANLLERCQIELGCDLDVHSGRRCPELNKRVGSSDKSQHLKCEAADFSPAGPDTEASIEAAFAKLARQVLQGSLHVGQLIIESAAGRDGARKVWIHISLGDGYRELAKCNQVLRMKDGKYEVYKEVA